VAEDQRRGCQRFEQIFELNDEDRFEFRERYQIQFGFEDDPEGSLGTDYHPGHVEWLG
jgi:hypothetical protein